MKPHTYRYHRICNNDGEPTNLMWVLVITPDHSCRFSLEVEQHSDHDATVDSEELRRSLETFASKIEDEGTDARHAVRREAEWLAKSLHATETTS